MCIQAIASTYTMCIQALASTYTMCIQALPFIFNIIFISKHGDGDPSKAYQVIKNTYSIINTHGVCGRKGLNTHTQCGWNGLNTHCPGYFVLGKKAMWTEALEYTLPS